jgi:hypothetical protein
MHPGGESRARPVIAVGGQKIHSTNKLFERVKIDFFVMASTAGRARHA